LITVIACCTWWVCRCGLEVSQWELEEHVAQVHHPFSCMVCSHRYSVKIGKLHSWM
jgi:hypothetical protein